MKHYFLDANILLDFLLRRDGFGPNALQLLKASEDGRAKFYVSSLVFSQLYYTLRKTNTATERIIALQELAGLVEIIPVGRPVIEAALTLGFTDFEDGLQYCAARTVPAIEAIVTRDHKGFASGALPVLTPPEALARLGS